MISILHPSRSRPYKSLETMTKWVLKAGTKDLEIIISLDNDDPALSEYQRLYQSFIHPYSLQIANNLYSVGAINRAARIAQGEILIVVSDDQEPCARWATRILKYTEGKKDWVLKVFDGIQPELITQPILDRSYYQRDGYIYYPEYKHLFADKEFTDVAMRRNRVIRKNIRLPHRHYSVLKKQPDEVYKRSDATYQDGKNLYLYRKSINFGL